MKLLLVHGRSQEDKNPAVLRHKWVSSLHAGAEGVGLELPISDEDIIFPYFGDALADLTSDEHPDHHDHDGDVAPITRGITHEDDIEFRCRILNDCFETAGITEDQIREYAEPEVRKAGPLSREWVQVGFGLLDQFVPPFSSRSLRFAAADVSMYLEDSTIQDFIESGIAKAVADVDPDEEWVVIGHSLGSIIAYRILSAGGAISSLAVRSFVTLGSPLGIRAVRTALEPIAHPPNVGSWFNAYDEGDAVALHPLNSRFFEVEPPIDNYSGVDNDTPNEHGISGYLTDPVVASRLVNLLSS